MKSVIANLTVTLKLKYSVCMYLERFHSVVFIKNKNNVTLD